MIKHSDINCTCLTEKQLLALGINPSVYRGKDGKSPIIGENNNWWYWDEEAGEYVDSGKLASIGNSDEGSIDFQQKQLSNAVIQPLATPPENPVIGQIYTDISGDKPQLLWYNGTEWAPMGGTVTPENYPSATKPSVSIKISNGSGMVEVGSDTSVSYTATFDPGAYTYGPDTGITVETWRVYDNDNPVREFTEPTGTISDISLSSGTDYVLTVEATHTDGAIPVSDQNKPYPAAQILAGTVTAKASISADMVSGYRKYFYGATTEMFDLNSENIRTYLTHSSAPVEAGYTFDLEIPKGSNQVIIAFPTNLGMTLESVIDTGAFNIDVYDIFQMSNVDVEGANGYEAISYDVYTYVPDVSLNKNKYKVTIA